MLAQIQNAERLGFASASLQIWAISPPSPTLLTKTKQFATQGTLSAVAFTCHGLRQQHGSLKTSYKVVLQAASAQVFQNHASHLIKHVSLLHQLAQQDDHDVWFGGCHRPCCWTCSVQDA